MSNKFLVPLELVNLTTTQRDAIANPKTGSEIFNTTTSQVEHYNGTAWVGGGSGTVVVNGITEETDPLNLGSFNTFTDLSNVPSPKDRMLASVTTTDVSGEAGIYQFKDLSAADSYYQQVLLSAPVSYFRFNEASGTAVSGQVTTPEIGSVDGSYGTGTLIGEPGLISNDSDKGFKTVSPGHRALLPEALTASTTTAASFSIIVDRPVGVLGFNNGMTALDISTNELKGSLALDLNSIYFTLGKIQAQTANVNPDGKHIYHVTTSAGGSCKLYVDGVLVSTQTGIPNPLEVDTSAFGINVGTNAVGNSYLPATYDEFVYYDKELTQTEITALYTSFSSTVATPGFKLRASNIKTFTGLSDTPTTYGSPGQIPVINATGDGMEFNSLAVPQPIPPVLTERIIDYSTTAIKNYSAPVASLSIGNTTFTVPTNTTNSGQDCSLVAFKVNGDSTTFEVSFSYHYTASYSAWPRLQAGWYDGTVNEVTNELAVKSAFVDKTHTLISVDVGVNKPPNYFDIVQGTSTIPLSVLGTSVSTPVTDPSVGIDVRIKYTKSNTSDLFIQVYFNNVEISNHLKIGGWITASTSSFYVGLDIGAAGSSGIIENIKSITAPIPDVGKHLVLNNSGTAYSLAPPLLKDMFDTPNYYGSAGQLLKVNAIGDGFEYAKVKAGLLGFFSAGVPVSSTLLLQIMDTVTEFPVGLPGSIVRAHAAPTAPFTLDIKKIVGGITTIIGNIDFVANTADGIITFTTAETINVGDTVLVTSPIDVFGASDLFINLLGYTLNPTY